LLLTLCGVNAKNKTKNLKSLDFSRDFRFSFGPSVEIRTPGLLNPIQNNIDTGKKISFLTSIKIPRKIRGFKLFFIFSQK